MNKLIAFIVLVVGMACAPVRAEWFTEQQAIMGTSITVTIWHKDAWLAERAIDAVMKDMHRINQSMSPWIAGSELARVNRDAFNKPVLVSKELFGLLKQAQWISLQSGGAFDVTFASLGHRYNYRKKIKPDQQTIANQLPLVDYRNLHLDETNISVRFSHKGMKIDLGGIAKGHAVERGAALLRAEGIKHGIVTAGGDSRIIGDRRGRPWLVGVRDPRKEEQQAVMLPLQNEAISTSGDYERYFEQDGVRYHHIINPKTGDSARTVRSASVIGPNATMTDALSTTIFVLGVEKGLTLIDTIDGYEAVVVSDKQKLFFSKGLASPAQ